MKLKSTGLKRKNDFAALYMRLSKEDSDSEISASIENQRKILRNFVKDNFLVIYDEYIDDGYSGTNMDRPAFKRMKSDIESGKIGVVITKDFSRLGRNIGQVMTMLDDYFVVNNVQYIAVSEGIDTMSGGVTGMLAPMLSFTNEMYAADISRKINASFNVKMSNGEFIGAFAPYGYRKDSQNKNHLLPDNESAQIVKQIFCYAKNGYSPKQIAGLLNDNNIPTPSLYRYMVNPHLNTDTFKNAEKWSPSIVSKLLRNEVYLGHTLQGKTHKPSFKSKHIANIPKQNWIVVKNTHTPLVDENTWIIARKKIQSRTKEREKGFINIFSGLAKCADCGKNMSSVATRKKGTIANLICGDYKLNGRKNCTNHTINYDTLYNIVLKALNQQISFTDDERNGLLNEMLKSIDNNTFKLFEAKKKLSQISSKLTTLFDNKFSGEIDDRTFENLRKKYEKEMSLYESIISEQKKTNEAMYNVDELKRRHNMLETLISEYENIRSLDSNILFKLIERINVHQGKYINGVKHQQVDIYFKFKCESKAIEIK